MLLLLQHSWLCQALSVDSSPRPCLCWYASLAPYLLLFALLKVLLSSPPNYLIPWPQTESTINLTLTQLALPVCRSQHAHKSVLDHCVY